MLTFKKHIVSLSIIVLLIPSVIQLVHAFEKHEHTICISKNDKHFHKGEIDCSTLHYQFQVFSEEILPIFDVIPRTFFKLTSFLGEITSSFYIIKKLSRAPPF
ncbi:MULTISPECIES: hypothetical protein [Tenacibaculum]|uniref:Uncharacterized protein n=1 Tax=Tenacibaculum mesophilum TaxID=104268 RepID=A0AAE9MMH8_9FLAO|nr:hypothetical protein [Tenacibaculum mesophilum]KAF9657620.1 hypothetical protein HBA12_10285 [Tenacibaculum mesophilum]UTD14200.1 hypothetical protein HER15_01335 [Tenacibaculum mesophilum]BFF37775.1 hypothetical protein BACT7_26370 [Tenacibaculum mesophilum]BFF41200.1 hypothetical protein BACY1_30050 [Tenacibaculum mesophilum]